MSGQFSLIFTRKKIFKVALNFQASGYIRSSLFPSAEALSFQVILFDVNVDSVSQKLKLKRIKLFTFREIFAFKMFLFLC